MVQRIPSLSEQEPCGQMVRFPPHDTTHTGRINQTIELS